MRRFAGALHRQGVQVGDVIAVMAPNCLEMLAAHYAVPMAGGVLNAIHTWLGIDEVAYILEHSGARLVLAHEACRRTATEALQHMERPCPVIWVGAPAKAGEVRFDTFVEHAEPLMEALITDEWQPICINYTWGTTGRPKGAVCHHRGAYLNALGSVITLELSHRTRFLWVLPMSHCNGWAHTWSVTAAAGTHVCLDRPDPAQILKMLSSERITHMCRVPALLDKLVNEPVFAQLEQRVTIGNAGSALSAELIAQLEARGFRLVHSYGLAQSYGPALCSTEQPGWDALTPHEKSSHLARLVPHPLGPDLELMDESGRLVPCDGKTFTFGEILLRGNTLMAGFYRDELGTCDVFKDGWFHTGYLAVRYPNGHIKIRDRGRDVIISGGEDIWACEIEHVLYGHPAVGDVAVVPMPDEKWGEVPCAFVELNPRAQPPSERELIELCRGHLAAVKIPKKFVFGRLPRTAIGAVSRRACRRLVLEVV